jgi:copper homeostasis protein (lipoprotein)
MRWLLSLLLILLLQGCSQQASNGSTAINAEFQYMADAALIRLCDSGERYPVAMEQAYIELERAYLASRVAPGAPAGVLVKGSLQPRPAMEGDQKVMTYIVEAFHSISPNVHCTDTVQPVIK